MFLFATLGSLAVSYLFEAPFCLVENTKTISYTITLCIIILFGRKGECFYLYVILNSNNIIARDLHFLRHKACRALHLSLFSYFQTDTADEFRVHKSFPPFDSEEGNIHVPDSFNIPLLASFSLFPMFIMCTVFTLPRRSGISNAF